MMVAATLVMVPLDVLFIFSGLVVNILLAFFFILVRPFLKSICRRINKVVAELLWLELVWLIDWWAGIKVVMFWACLTIYGSVKFFQRSKLLSSWKGLAASAAFLALVTILMQSQRDRHHKIP